MGFYESIAYVVKRVPSLRQTFMFSATYPEGIAKLSAQFLRQPERITVESQHDDQKIRQQFFEVQDNERLSAVSTLLNHYRPVSTLAFCNTKQQCKSLLAELQAQGFNVLALHGELEQRDRILQSQLFGASRNRCCRSRPRYCRS
jgi:ATP-dependent RNA helicase DbpA